MIEPGGDVVSPIHGEQDELMQHDGLYRKLYEIQYREAVVA